MNVGFLRNQVLLLERAAIFLGESMSYDVIGPADDGKIARRGLGHFILWLRAGPILQKDS